MSSPESGPPSKPEKNPKGPMDWMTAVFPILLLVLVGILLVYTNLIRGGFFR